MVLLRAHVAAGVQASVAHPGALRISDRSLRRGHIFEKAAPVAQHASRWRCSSACGRAAHVPRHGHQEPAVTTSPRVSRMAKDQPGQNHTEERNHPNGGYPLYGVMMRLFAELWPMLCAVVSCGLYAD